MNAARNGRWHHSGLTQHMETCDGEIEGPIILCTMNAKTKAKLKRDLRIREALEIKRHNCGPGHGMNEDWGSYVKTTQWGPVFSGMWLGRGLGSLLPLCHVFVWVIFDYHGQSMLSLSLFFLLLILLKYSLFSISILSSTIKYDTSNSVKNLVTYLSNRTWFLITNKPFSS